MRIKTLLTSLPMVRKDVVINPNSQLGPMSFTLKECNNNKCIQENKYSVSHYLGRKGSASRRTQLLNNLKFVVPSRKTSSVQILKEAQSNTKTPSYQILFFLTVESSCSSFVMREQSNLAVNSTSFKTGSYFVMTTRGDHHHLQTELNLLETDLSSKNSFWA